MQRMREIQQSIYLLVMGDTDVFLFLTASPED
jgi:Na+-transporting methylmalonyl-CoA/oxaloacetate decarboxylase gamma subunit